MEVDECIRKLEGKIFRGLGSACFGFGKRERLVVKELFHFALITLSFSDLHQQKLPSGLHRSHTIQAKRHSIQGVSL